MVKLDGTKISALQSVAAHKQAADERIAESKRVQKKLADQARREVLRVVIDALESGVPQLRVATEGLGYNQTNGIRSYFGLAMKGGLLDELKKLYQTLGLSEVEQEFALAEEELAASTSESLWYKTDPYDGNPAHYLERPDGDKWRFIWGWGTLTWQKRPKDVILTEQEIALIEGTYPRPDYHWNFDPTITREEERAAARG